MVSWIGQAAHGVTTYAETPAGGVLEDVAGVAWTAVTGLRQGWGVTYRGAAGRACWFHTPVPTVGLFGHAAATLGEFYVTFEAQGTARVTSVHLWNGDVRLRTYDGLSLAGRHTFSQLFTPELAMTATGVNVSTLVQFGSSASQVVFLGAYARFVTP